MSKMGCSSAISANSTWEMASDGDWAKVVVGVDEGNGKNERSPLLVIISERVEINSSAALEFEFEEDE